MKIFRYRLRNGNFIDFICHKKAQKSQTFGGGTVDVADATNGLDSLETVELVAQLLAQVTDVHVDAAIERRQLAT